MPHPSELPDNADIVEEVRALAHRVLAAIKHLDPTRYHNIWEQGGLHASREALVVGEFVLTCKPDRSVLVFDVSGPRHFPIFNAYLGDGPLDFAWDPYACRKFLVPALQRVLLLDDLASL